MMIPNPAATRDARRARSLSARSIAALPVALALAACSGDVVNMGEDPPGGSPVPPPPASRCAEAPTLSGDVLVRNQAELDALEGCATIEGDLVIEPFFHPDLRPLRALVTVRGELGLGAASQFAVSSDWSSEEALDANDVFESGAFLESLEGLERLEAVGSLSLFDVAASSLEPLSQLRQLTAHGTLSLVNCDALTSLRPLAQLQGIQRLIVGANNLESLDGLQIGEQLAWLHLAGARLADIGALSNLRRVEQELSIAGTALRDLAPLGQLGFAGNVTITTNPWLESLHGLEALAGVAQYFVLNNAASLVDASALARLTRAELFALEGNEKLQRLPELPLLRVNTLQIRNNPSLEELPLLRGTFNGFGRNSDPEIQLIERGQVEISRNPSLQRFSMPREWRAAVYAIIEDNASLRELDMSDVESLDLLEIKGNPVLDSVRLGRLDTVDTLDVSDNPQLAPATFDALRTFERTPSGNAADAP